MQPRQEFLHQQIAATDCMPPSGFLCFGISSVSARKRSGWVVVVVIRVEAAAEVRTREKKARFGREYGRPAVKQFSSLPPTKSVLAVWGGLPNETIDSQTLTEGDRPPPPGLGCGYGLSISFPWLAATLGRGHPWTKHRNSHMRWFTSLPRQFFTRERRPVLGLVRSLRSLSP